MTSTELEKLPPETDENNKPVSVRLSRDLRLLVRRAAVEMEAKTGRSYNMSDFLRDAAREKAERVFDLRPAA